jgi:geranylgeranyl diphosphate synthase type II
MIENNIISYAEDFEKKLDKLFDTKSCEYGVIYDACRYSLLLGGKRLRPFLINRFYKLCGGEGDCSLGFEAAIECIHTYSLIHDDLPCMDNDDMRRGKPSCHKKFGEANALLAGDALLTKAWQFAASTNNIDSKNVIKAISVLSGLSGIDGMIGGQIVDLIYENKQATEEVLRLICSLKTGALIKAACLVGSILAGADDDKFSAAKEYAENLGLAFQIVDDILDEIGTVDKLGKPIHSDKENSKSTFVSVLGIEKCNTLVNQLTNKAKAALGVFGNDAKELLELADYLCTRDH